MRQKSVFSLFGGGEKSIIRGSERTLVRIIHHLGRDRRSCGPETRLHGAGTNGPSQTAEIRASRKMKLGIPIDHLVTGCTSCSFPITWWRLFSTNPFRTLIQLLTTLPAGHPKEWWIMTIQIALCLSWDRCRTAGGNKDCGRWEFFKKVVNWLLANSIVCTPTTFRRIQTTKKWWTERSALPCDRR